MYVLSVISHH